MEILEKIEEAKHYVNQKTNKAIDLAIVLGSGLSDLVDILTDQVVIDYKEIPHFPISTVAGHAGKLVFGHVGERRVLMMQGRFHYYEGYKLEETTFPIRVMQSLKIGKLIVTNAAGAINQKFKPGDIILIKDHMNLTGNNPLVGQNLETFGVRFPDMSVAYDEEFILLAKKVAKREKIRVQEGVYAYMTGPCYETPSEVRMLRGLGADMVGMSTVPEVVIARHGKMRVLGITCATNMAAGILKQPLDHKEVIETANRVKDRMIRYTKEIIKEI